MGGHGRKAEEEEGGGEARDKRMQRRGGANRQRAKCAAIKNGMQIH